MRAQAQRGRVFHSMAGLLGARRFPSDGASPCLPRSSSRGVRTVLAAEAVRRGGGRGDPSSNPVGKDQIPLLIGQGFTSSGRAMALATCAPARGQGRGCTRQSDEALRDCCENNLSTVRSRRIDRIPGLRRPIRVRRLAHEGPCLLGIFAVSKPTENVWSGRVGGGRRTGIQRSSDVGGSAAGF
jgi:hypothetical protein